MAIVDEAALIAFVKKTMGASYSKVSDEGFSTAVTQASQELKWSLPLDEGFKEFWMVERTKRYVIQILLVEAAPKFQYKQIYLQHRFNHYLKLLQMMDEQFQKAIEENPTLFDTGTYERLVDYIENTFAYDILGNEM